MVGWVSVNMTIFSWTLNTSKVGIKLLKYMKYVSCLILQKASKGFTRNMPLTEV